MLGKPELEVNVLKKMFLVLSVIFAILAFIGAGYVLYNQGQVNAGYAVVPMVFSLAFIAAYRNKNK